MTQWDLRFEGKLPPGPNSRLHWRWRSQYNREWRTRAARAVWEAQIPKGQARIHLAATVYRRALGVADEDNDRARLKPLVDGIVDTGVIVSDSRGRVVWGEVNEARGPAGLILHISTIEESP